MSGLIAKPSSILARPQKLPDLFTEKTKNTCPLLLWQASKAFCSFSLPPGVLDAHYLYLIALKMLSSLKDLIKKNFEYCAGFGSTTCSSILNLFELHAYNLLATGGGRITDYRLY